MITNPIDTSFSVSGEAWFISEVFLMAAKMESVARVERMGPADIRIWPGEGHTMEDVANFIQAEMDTRYKGGNLHFGQTE